MFKKADYVLAVYKTQSFTEAAKSLFISQPSLSVAIKQTEEMIGAPLFERTRGKVLPTEIGKEYIKSALKINSVKKDFLNVLNDIYLLESGTLSVGGSNYISCFILPQIISEFSTRYPKIDVSLHEANSTNLRRMLDNEILDIVIDSFDAKDENYDYDAIFTENIYLCVPKNRPVNKKLAKFAVSKANIKNASKTVDIKCFKDESFVLQKPGNDMYMRAMHFFDDAAITPNVAFSVDQLNISFSFAEQGLGICFVTDTFIKCTAESDSVVFYKLGGNYTERTLCAAYKKGRYHTCAMTEFVSRLKKMNI